MSTRARMTLTEALLVAEVPHWYGLHDLERAISTLTVAQDDLEESKRKIKKHREHLERGLS